MKANVFRVIHQSEGVGAGRRRRRQGYKKDLWNVLWYWMPVVLFVLAMTYVSSLSTPEQKFSDFLQAVNTLLPIEGDVFSMLNDKFYHIAEYALLGILTYRALGSIWNPKHGVSAGLVAVLGVVLFGGLDEIHQWFTPLRYSDGWDFLADGLGGLLGVATWQTVMKIPLFRLLDETIPLKLQIALGIPTLKL